MLNLFTELGTFYTAVSTMEPTYLKFGTLMKFLKLITFCSWEKFDIPNRIRDNKRKQDLRE